MKNQLLLTIRGGFDLILIKTEESVKDINLEEVKMSLNNLNRLEGTHKSPTFAAVNAKKQQKH